MERTGKAARPPERLSAATGAEGGLRDELANTQARLADAQMEAGRFADAETNLSHLLRDPNNAGRPDLLHMQAECLLALNRPVEAREIYRQLSAREGASDARAWIGIARTAYQIRDEKTFRRAASRASFAAFARRSFTTFSSALRAASSSALILSRSDCL